MVRAEARMTTQVTDNFHTLCLDADEGGRHAQGSTGRALHTSVLL